MTTVNDYWSIKVSGLINGQEWVNQWWYDTVTTNTDSDNAEKLYNHFAANYANLEPYLHESCTITEINVQNWVNPLETFVGNPNLVGDVITAAMPRWIAYGIKFNRAGTGFNYPYKRVPGVPEANTTGDAVNADVKAGIITAMTPLTEFFSLGGFTARMSTVNPYPLFGTPAVAPPAYNIQYPTAVIDVIISTQKSRK